ncbi:MAG: UDP-N-acetylmuramoyl-L-alanyl-D-glutamate--2,6-diaminopimelate ligase, partial [Candidatus Aerophobetes bacterium]|nr:UDP-N-acetylmuramoyl-L-alanyl-D-glutamate--2,6-diaminopimelate ligase [Candidatus Aerophobetes bacterium]
MNLKKLISNLKIEKISGNPDIEIEGLVYDSRKVRKNFLFIAIRGFKQDGHQFISQAIKKGAKAIIVEKDTPILSPDVVLIKVPSSRLALSMVSNYFYGFPSQKMKVIGITGTNGKTTTIYMLESILTTANFKVGKISTIDYNLGDKLYSSHPSFITTPEPEELQRMLRTMADKKVEYVAVEVSSHSLVLHRVEGIEFDWLIFTNLSPEHLDFHKTMDNYLEAKASLFKKSESNSREKTSRKAVINVDEEAGNYILRNTPYPTITYGIKERAFFQAKIVKTEIERTSFILKMKGEEKGKIDLSLPGIHNVYNALAAAAVGFGENISLSLIKRGLESLKRVPGRLELIENRRHLKIFVDYAHTQDGLDKV